MSKKDECNVSDGASFLTIIALRLKRIIKLTVEVEKINQINEKGERVRAFI